MASHTWRIFSSKYRRSKASSAALTGASAAFQAAQQRWGARGDVVRTATARLQLKAAAPRCGGDDGNAGALCCIHTYTPGCGVLSCGCVAKRRQRARHSQAPHRVASWHLGGLRRPPSPVSAPLTALSFPPPFAVRLHALLPAHDTRSAEVRVRWGRRSGGRGPGTTGCMPAAVSLPGRLDQISTSLYACWYRSPSFQMNSDLGDHRSVGLARGVQCNYVKLRFEVKVWLLRRTPGAKLVRSMLCTISHVLQMRQRAPYPKYRYTHMQAAQKKQIRFRTLSGVALLVGSTARAGAGVILQGSVFSQKQPS